MLQLLSFKNHPTNAAHAVEKHWRRTTMLDLRAEKLNRKKGRKV
jgi:hypothetical protein